MRKQVFFIFILITLLLGACQKKDELTLPTSVDVQFTLYPYQETDLEIPSEQSLLKSGSILGGSLGLIKKLEVDEAIIFLTDIEIEGIREQGEDVFLAMPYDPPHRIVLKGNAVSEQKLAIDLPQGVYQNLEIRLFLGNDEHPALQFTGQVSPGNSPTVTFNVLYEIKEEISIFASRKDGRPTDNIVLNKNQNEQVSLTLDADYLFKYFPVSLLATNNKNEQALDNQIIISNIKKQDKSFFSLMQGRLEKSFSFVFE
jgi:hypothetical protein